MKFEEEQEHVFDPRDISKKSYLYYFMSLGKTINIPIKKIFERRKGVNEISDMKPILHTSAYKLNEAQINELIRLISYLKNNLEFLNINYPLDFKITDLSDETDEQSSVNA